MALFSEEVPGLSCFGDEKIPCSELPEVKNTKYPKGSRGAF
jgi:hypothetical protein